MPIRVVVQGGRRLFRDSLASYLAGQPGIQVVASVAGAGQVAWVCGERRPDAAVLEADPAGWDPAGLAAALRTRRPDLRIVGVSERLGPSDVARLRGAGFDALVSRSTGAAALVEAITAPGAGHAPLLDAGVPAPATPPVLTGREGDVLRLLAQGATGVEIARSLGISLRTAENYKRRLFAKLAVSSRTQAVAAAARAGLLRLDPALEAAEA